MENMQKLKDMLTRELDEYARKGELSAGALDIVDKLSHALKSVTTVMAMEDGGYSGTGRSYGYPQYYYDDGRSYDGRSYAGRMNARRDSRGRYSRDYSGDMVEKLRDMMDEAPDQETRHELQRLVSKFEKM